tara:strand:- start:58 stop:756 length:699 start_codon:yes stop_codon:yes gene_type:complete
MPHASAPLIEALCQEVAMFTDLVKILDFFINSIKDLSKFNKSSERKEALLEMLKTYFYLYDAHLDGVKLLKSVDSDPINYVKSLKGESLQEHLKTWDQILRRQGVRLYEAQKYINSQSYLAVINPGAVDSISKVIGYKMDRLVTLHGLGAGLFFRNVFPTEETPENLANLVLQVLTKQEAGLIDKAEVGKELDSLNVSLDEFRTMLNNAMSKEELLELSDNARNETYLETRA